VALLFGAGEAASAIAPDKQSISKPFAAQIAVDDETDRREIRARAIARRERMGRIGWSAR
jgi:hypothetical protein